MHESFEDELKNRLQHYAEDPDDGLWSNIASSITSKISHPSWIVWSNRAGLALTGIIFLASMYNLNFNTNLAASFSQSLTQNRNVNEVKKNEKEISVANEKNLVDQDNGHDIISKIDDDTSLNMLEENSKTQSSIFGGEETFGAENVQHADDKKIKTISSLQNNAQINSRIVKANDHKALSIHNNDEVKTSLVSERQVNNSERISDNDVNEKNSLGGNVVAESLIDMSGKNIFVSKNDKPDLHAEKNKSDSLKFIHDGKDIRRENKLTSTGAQAKKTNATRKVSLYFLAMPTFGYQRVVANRNDNIIIDNIKKVSAFSYKRLGIRAELGMMFPLSSKFNITGGILYYQRKQTISYVEKVLDSSYVTGADDHQVNLDPHFVYQNKSFEYELKNIGVQLGANVVLLRNKFLHTAGGGIEFQKGLNNLSKEQKDFSGSPSTFVFYNIFYRIQYPAEGKLRAIFQPTFNYSLYLNQNMNAPFYVKPYGFGLNFGITYNF